MCWSCACLVKQSVYCDRNEDFDFKDAAVRANLGYQMVHDLTCPEADEASESAVFERLYKRDFKMPVSGEEAAAEERQDVEGHNNDNDDF